jgi:hypothetical protein
VGKKQRNSDRGQESKSARRETAARIKREHERKERRKHVLIYSAVAVVALALIGGAAWGVRSEKEAIAAPIEELTEVEDQEANHVPEPIAATELPPTGGNHSQIVQNCGVYDQPVGAENAVHSMEHGAVWLTYRPDLPENEVNQLRDIAAGKSYLLLSPYPDQASPIVATAWGRQIKVETTEDSRLQRFVKKFVGGKQAPEPGAPCSGGTGSPVV